MKIQRHITLSALLLLITVISSAHEIRPAYLQINQVSETEYEILWKIPARGEMIPKIYPVFPSVLEVEEIGLVTISGGAARTVYKGTSTEDLHGKDIAIDGLSKTLIDCLVSIEFLDGEQLSILLQADRPKALIPTRAGLGQVVVTYLRLGVEHILLGFDHLLFVLALLIITKGTWRLVKTITAFTIAHSITLSLAALGFVGLPGGPVEAIIALSIVFLAVEIIHHQNGKDGMAVRYPWIIAFVFGLLHGFGFAGALTEIGLPQKAIPATLLFFNVGVEIGQLIFVAAVLGLLWGLSKVKIKWPEPLRVVPPYAIGSIASFWLIERVMGFL